MPIKSAPIMTFLTELNDRRRTGACDHNLIDVLMIAICTILSGGEFWQDMTIYGEEKCKWLKKVAKKSNEITAIPELLEAINLRGALITPDATSCQKSIAETCVQQETVYLLAVERQSKNSPGGYPVCHRSTLGKKA